MNEESKKQEVAVLGGGCFWCIEAIYQRVRGIIRVTSGYAGGEQIDPTYHSMGNHAEVVELVFDPAIISYEKILEIFWHIHDPTTLNRQGNDVGEQYRSIILYSTDKQRAVAEKSKQEIATSLWDGQIVTTIEPLKQFNAAEEYHSNYYNKNPENAYCQAIINQKIAKFEKKFANLLV